MCPFAKYTKEKRKFEAGSCINAKQNFYIFNDISYLIPKILTLDDPPCFLCFVNINTYCSFKKLSILQQQNVSKQTLKFLKICFVFVANNNQCFQ
uniref:Uncharacterized protein n=1 Tax=Ciona intestinalis TaxID=7719 RepID=H2XKN3_CIOIN